MLCKHRVHACREVSVMQRVCTKECLHIFLLQNCSASHNLRKWLVQKLNQLSVLWKLYVICHKQDEASGWCRMCALCGHDVKCHIATRLSALAHEEVISACLLAFKDSQDDSNDSSVSQQPCNLLMAWHADMPKCPCKGINWWPLTQQSQLKVQLAAPISHVLLYIEENAFLADNRSFGE